MRVSFRRPTGSFTRPADTTAYASGDLVANSTTAGSVTPVAMSQCYGPDGQFRLDRIKLHKSGTSVTNAQFRVHLYNASTITCANGDNSAWSTNKVAAYLGSFDVTIDKAFTDGAAGTVITGLNALTFDTVQNLSVLLEARAAYTPSSAEVFTVTFDISWE